jgi:hypothetical protein
MKVIQGLPKKVRRGYTEYGNAGTAPASLPDEVLIKFAQDNYNMCRTVKPHWPEEPQFIIVRDEDRTGLGRTRWAWYLQIKEP